MSGLVQEPLRDSITRGDGIVYFTVNGDFEERFLDPTGFTLDNNEIATDVTKKGDRIAVRFRRPLVTGDKLWC